MRVEQQGKDECMLATIAALKGVPLAEVRSKALIMGKISKWTILVRRPLAFWKVTKALCLEYDIPFDIVEYRALINQPSSGYNNLLEIPNKGKGVVTVRIFGIDDDYCYLQHIMPFENGLVYDPDKFEGEDDEVKGETWPEYLSRLGEQSPDYYVKITKVGLLEE